MKEIYLDGAANTPLDKEVYKAMKPYMKPDRVGNSYSVHDFGVRNMMDIELARSDIAEVLGAKSQEVLFTSGASESNNWVIKSIAAEMLFHRKKGEGKCHIICGATEHSSVLNACKEVSAWGMNVTYVSGTGRNGAITAKDIKPLLYPGTALVCVMAINNETGVANEVDQIAQMAKKNKSLTLIDCTQWMSYGGADMALVKKFPHGDFFTFSAHKIYGPTGIGCLIAREDVLHNLSPLINGGAQENGLRGGTSNVAGIIGMAKAMKLMSENNYEIKFREYFNYIYAMLCFRYKVCKMNAIPTHCNIMSLNFGDTCYSDNLAAVFATYGVAVSAGSACDAAHVGEFNPSHVLTDLGLLDNEIKNTIRVSFTKFTSWKEVDKFVDIAVEIAENYIEEEKKNGNKSKASD